MAGSVISVDSPEVATLYDLKKMHDANFNARNLLNLEYDKIYNMDWEFSGDLQGIETITTSISPSIRNRILGMKRLLDGTDAIIKCTSQDIKYDKDALERSFKRWLQQSSKITKKRVTSDMALSALMYGEIQVGLTSTSDLLKSVPDNRKVQVKRISEQAPFLINTWHPNEGTYDMDDIGLTSFVRTTETNWGMIKAFYGKYLTPEQMEKKNTDTATLVRAWDLDNFAVFVGQECIYAEKHGLPEIPIIIQLVDGSSLFSKIEEQRQSIMFAVEKAKLFDQQCSINTLIATVVMAMGVNPMYRHNLPTGAENSRLDIDYSVAGGAIHLKPGETYEPISNKGLVDPALRELLLGNEKTIEESTIFGTALGAPVEANIAFSTVSLLAQQGRLPLVGAQRAMGDTLSAVFELGTRLLKTAKKSFKMNGIDLSTGNIPDDLQTDVTIDIKLPQDKLQLANIANLLLSNGLADIEWIQSNILNIPDTTTMRKNIVLDKLYKVLGDTKINMLVQTYTASNNQPPVDPNAEPTGGAQGVPAGIGETQGIPGQSAEQVGMNATGTPSTGLTGMPSAEAGILPSQGRGTVPIQGA